MSRRFSLLAPTLALLAALLVGGPALSALRLGTPSGETLTGTKGNDHITGDAGDDTLIGKAGNDTYFFADGWGTDELVEKPAEGTDTLNFRGVNNEYVNVSLVREWSAAGDYPRAFTSSRSSRVNLRTEAGIAKIENVILGNFSGDWVEGGTGTNVLQPGGGATDWLNDFAGYHIENNGGLLDLPVSNDVFKGFASNTGTDFVSDWGGTGDVVDMRPFSTADVYISRFNADPTFMDNQTLESLQIVTSPTTQVVLVGHYGAYQFNTSSYGQNGRIEKLIFADTTITDPATLSQAAAVSTETVSGKQAVLADAAEGLAKEARALLSEMPEPGSQRIDPGAGGRHAGPGAGTGPEKDRGTADRGKSTQKDTSEKKVKKHDKQDKKREQKAKSDKPGKRHEPQHRTERLVQRDLGLRHRAWGQEQAGSR